MPAAALPVIPAAACPATAAALGGAGLGPACHATATVASAAGSVAGSLASGVAGFGVDAVLDGIASWVSSGAVWLLGQIGSLLASTTAVDLGASWFTGHYQTMAGLAGVVVVPLLLAGVIQAVHRQSASMLVRSVVVNVPLALLLTAVAVQLVGLGLSLTDAMSSAVSQGSGVDTGHLFDGVATALQAPAATAVSAADPAPPTFIVLLGSLAVVVGALLLWIELVVRAAAVYVAVLFLPLALASLAWPAIAHWCRRLVDTLVALILGKFVVVAVLALGVSALGAGVDGTGTGNPGFTSVLAGAALLALAAAAPWALFRLLPFLEAGAVAHLEGVGRRTAMTATGPTRSLAQTALRMAAAGGSGGTSEVGTALAAGAGRAAGATGGAVRSGIGAATAGPGGGDTPDTDPEDGPTVRRVERPDLGPSTLELTGVGSPAPPGSSIPGYPADDVGREVMRARLARLGVGLDGQPLPDPVGTPVGEPEGARVVDGSDGPNGPDRPGTPGTADPGAGRG